MSSDDCEKHETNCNVVFLIGNIIILISTKINISDFLPRLASCGLIFGALYISLSLIIGPIVTIS